MIIDEDWYEHTIIDHLVDSMGYEHLFGPDVRRSSENYQDVFIPDVLPEALSNVNQGLPAKAIDEAILKIKNIEGGSLEQRNEILNNIQQPCFWQHSIKHGLPRSVLRFGIVPIDRLPCHVTILVRGNGTNSSFSHIAHYAEHIRHKQARNLLHVLTKLQISVRRISFHT